MIFSSTTARRLSMIFSRSCWMEVIFPRDGVIPNLVFSASKRSIVSIEDWSCLLKCARVCLFLGVLSTWLKIEKQILLTFLPCEFHYRWLFTWLDGTHFRRPFASSITKAVDDTLQCWGRTDCVILKINDINVLCLKILIGNTFFVLVVQFVKFNIVVLKVLIQGC